MYAYMNYYIDIEHLFEVFYTCYMINLIVLLLVQITPKQVNGTTLFGKLVDTRAIAGGRLTTDKDNIGFGNFLSPMPPSDAEENWQLLNLDEQSLSKIKSTKLMELLLNLSPEVNRALWDFLRFCNPGYSIVCEKKSAQKVLDQFIRRLDRLYGSFDVLLSKIFTGCFLRGAIFVELILSESSMEAIDLAVIDPAASSF